MIGTLAHKRTNLAALAVLVALALALFAVLQSVAAIDGSLTLEDREVHVIDIDPAYDAVETDDEIIAEVTYDGSANTVTVKGRNAGTTIVTIKDTDGALPDLVYEVVVLPWGINKIEFVDESDGIVAAGPQVTVRVTLQSSTLASTVNLTIPTTGLSIQSGDTTTQSDTQVPDDGSTNDVTEKTADFIINTAGAPAGDYTLTFTADYNGPAFNEPTGPQPVIETLTLTVGEAGEGLAAASLSAANVKGDPAQPSDDADAAPDATNKRFGSTIHLVVSSTNSLGNAANDADINQVVVFAVGATVDGDENSKTYVEDDDTPDDDVTATQAVAISRTSPGTVDVSATVIGPAGDVKTDTLTLVFSGDAETLSLGDPDDQLGQQGDSITVELTAVDEAGNPAAINPLQTTSVKLLDADGETAGNVSASEAQKIDTKGTDDTEDDDSIPTVVVITISSDPNEKADTGVYTLEVMLGSKSTATVEFEVVGGTDKVDVEASSATSDTIGDVITVTASLTDEADNPVIDGTEVNFSVTANTGLMAIGSSHANTNDPDEDSNGPLTKDGSASVKFVVVGAGTSVVSATAGDTGATGVVVIMSTAGATGNAAMMGAAGAMHAEPSLSDFSRLSGLVSYSGPDTTASALSALLAGRASAIWLSNNGSWILYASVDGVMVQDSSDFTVTSGDVLYISN